MLPSSKLQRESAKKPLKEWEQKLKNWNNQQLLKSNHTQIHQLPLEMLWKQLSYFWANRITISRWIIDIPMIFHNDIAKKQSVFFRNGKIFGYSWEKWARNGYKLLKIFGWQRCWWHRYVSDFMMMTDFRCLWQNHYVDDFFRYVGDFLNVMN